MRYINRLFTYLLTYFVSARVALKFAFADRVVRIVRCMFGIVAFRVDMGGYVKLMIGRLYSLGQYVPYQHHRVRLPVAAAAVAAAARRHCSNYRHNVC